MNFLVKNLKCIPIVGGLIGGSVDAIETRTIGKTTKKVFS